MERTLEKNVGMRRAKLEWNASGPSRRPKTMTMREGSLKAAKTEARAGGKGKIMFCFCFLYFISYLTHILTISPFISRFIFLHSIWHTFPICSHILFDSCGDIRPDISTSILYSIPSHILFGVCSNILLDGLAGILSNLLFGVCIGREINLAIFPQTVCPHWEVRVKAVLDQGAHSGLRPFTIFIFP